MTTQSEMIRWMQAFALGIGLLALGACATGGNRSVYYAAYSGDTKAVEALLSSGGDPNELVTGGWTPLMIAAAEGHSRTVNTLIKAGANVNAKNKLDRTALMFATRYGFESIVTDLIEASYAGDAVRVASLITSGADVNVTDPGAGGTTALYWATYRGRASIVRDLLAAGADPNIKIHGNTTPLELAASRGGQTSIAIMLLEHGADPNTKADVGGSKLAPTALTAAQQQGHIKIVERLKAAGARE